MPDLRRLAIALLLAAAGRAALAVSTLTVNLAGDGHDANPGNGVCELSAGGGNCTLRAAIEEANSLSQSQSVTVAIPAMTIDLSLGEIPVAGGQPITLQGAGWRLTRIRRQSGAASQRFLFHTAGDLTLRGVEVSGFEAPGGGAILSSAQSYLVLEDSRFLNNHVPASVVGYAGGAVETSTGVALQIHRCNFEGNIMEANGSGGAVYTSGPTFEITDSNFSSNTSTSGGGAFSSAYNAANGTIARSLFSYNYSLTNGGAIWVGSGSFVNLVNSTLADNIATHDGGAIYATGASTQLHVFNSTIAANTCDYAVDGSGQGGGIDNEGISGLTMSNSILSGNTGSLFITQGAHWIAWPQDCAGPLVSAGYNIIRNNDEALCLIFGGFTTGDPQLQPLDWYGGPWPTMAIAPGSPAVDTGNPGGCKDLFEQPIATDQRGSTRPFGVACDLGAFEYGAMLFTDDFELETFSRWSATGP